MNLTYNYVADASVLKFFARCSQRERNELVRIFELLAESPHQRDAWVRRMISSHNLFTKRFGRWLVTYWPDDPVKEVRIVAVERVFA